MARRWRTLYMQCELFDGTIPDAPTPTEQRANRIFNYTRGTQPPRPIWHPQTCTFARIEPPGAPLRYIYEQIDLDIPAERRELAELYRCTLHDITPVLWARNSALTRRVQPLISARWEPKVETVHWTTAGGAPRESHVSIWFPRRPAPRTIHTFAALAKG